jgi:putative DNA primase/helicase
MPVSARRQLPLAVCDFDLADLRASGLDDATIRAAGIYTERDPTALALILNYDRAPSFCTGGGMVFPFFDSEGNRNGYATVKPHQPRIRDGKPVKYEAPLNEPPHAYISPASRARLNDGVREVVIVEGIKKALAVEQLGYAVIGLSGVWNWKVKDEERLQDDLEGSEWAGRTAYVCFD